MSVGTSNTPNTAPRQNQVQKLFICDQAGCGKSFPKIFHFKRHQKSHLKGTQQPLNRYKCDEEGCKAQFFLPAKLKAHQLVVHHGERPFKCDFKGCSKSYKKESHLKRHRATSHCKEAVTSKEVMCKSCGNTYCNKYVLEQHMAIAHADHDDAVTANSTKKSDIEKKHICNEPGCNAAFTRPYRLKNHKLTVHGNDKPFQCQYPGCDKSYTNESHLARHKTTNHYPTEMDTEKEVICGEKECGRIFSNKYNLKKHILRIHTPRPFSCVDCGEQFKRKSQLHAHKVEVHNKEAPYKCDSCPRTFVHLHLYNKHLKDHKTYKCDCEMTFDKWTKFVEHRRTECAVKPKEYKCVICNKTFNLKYRLTQHSLKVHVPDSQIDHIKCPYLNCNRLYKTGHNLRDHIRTYHEKIFNSVKAIKCTEKDCDGVFNSNKNLKQHLRTHHHGLAAKVRKPRKPRKDKGKPKKSVAWLFSGVEVTAEEHYGNTTENMNENLKEHLLDEDGCRKNDSKFKNVKDKTKDQTSHESIINNIEVKGKSTDHDVTSFSVVSMDIDVECSKNPIALDVNKLKESIISVNDNVKNLNNAASVSAEENEDCDKHTEEMNEGHSKTADTGAISSSSSDMVVDTVVDSDCIVIVEIPSNENISDVDNGEINNIKGVSGLEYKSGTIVCKALITTLKKP